MPRTALALNDPPPRAHANALAPGTLLMEYRLEQVLGAGGFGITYLGWDTHLEKHVAIKEYLPSQLAMRALDGSVIPIATEQKYDYVWGLERFMLEARTLARFSHPHIVRVNRYVEANATAYMVMDYEAGVSLTHWFMDHPQPDEGALKAIVLPILAGLEAVHAQGFLHRDIKPANVYMRENGTPVLLDFGAARQAIGHRSMSLTSIVSPGYAPLEQYASDGNQGPWTDVYSISAVLYRAVTGENPPEAVSRMRIDRVSARLDAVASRYSGTFLKSIALGMAIDEKLRPQSVAQWREVLDGQGSVATEAAVTAGVVAGSGNVGKAGMAPSAAIPVRARASAVDTLRTRAIASESSARRWRWVACAALLITLAGVLLREGSKAPGVVASPRPTERSVSHRTPAQPPTQPDLVVEAPPPPVTTVAAAPLADPQALRTGAAPSPLAPADTDRSAATPPPSSNTGPTQAAPHAPAFAAPAPQKGPPGLMRDFERADKNGDGALSLAEAREGMPRLVRDFERVDANGDGRVTPIELQRFVRPGPERGPRPN